MAATSQYRPWRVLLVFFLALFALVLWAFWPGLDHAPRLGLDLRGGTQVVLAPQPIEEGGEITQEQLEQTKAIIENRVNGIGVAEAETQIQGSGSDAVIVVSVPGVSQDRIVDLVGQTALLNFRPVDSIVAPNPTSPTAPGKKAQDQSDEGTQIVQAKTDSEAFNRKLAKLDCTLESNTAGGSPDDPTQWLGTCDTDGAAKYKLSPAFIRGTNIDAASAQLPQQGVGGWVVNLDFDNEGAKQLAEISTELAPKAPPQNQFAIVLDGVVVSAPAFNEAILGGSAQIEGNFTAEEAQDLANVLKFGALPVTLDVQAVDSVSPTLGADQLWAGILAGFIGLALVAVYLMLYYRALGVVAVLSLVVAGVITYSAFVVLGRTIGFTLTLAGIAGAIVSIGITADSFVVYFERLRDEIRDGRSLRQAADAGWLRARRTLLAADFVSLLAAVVLYFLSVGSVRGFAFALGLTTVVDVVVAFLFTRPVVALLCRSRWMAKGGALTGVSPDRLGVSSLGGRQREKGQVSTPATRRPAKVDARKFGGEV